MGMTLVRVHRALSHGWRTLEAATAEKEPSVLTRAHKCAASVAPPPPGHSQNVPFPALQV